MNIAMRLIPHLATALIRRIRYRYGFPFIASVVLAVATIARFQPKQATSIWTFALLALIATAFALLCGGQFRTLYVAIAVTPPFLFVLQWFLQMRSWMPDFPSKPVAEYFLYFVVTPILLVWTVSTMLSRTERQA
jgi:uncharacterized membrane protein YjjP (DUF1212 family)